MKSISVLFLLVYTVAAYAQPDYSRYTALLQKHVSESGKVNYAALKKDRSTLDAVVADFEKQQPGNWSAKEQKAYWINAYNLFTLKLMTDNYPVSSIMKLDNGKTWDVKRISIGGKQYSLNQIENEILRPQFKDARIHFAINCAAVSCPWLYNKAYLPTTLESQLEARTKLFIRSAKNSIGSKKIVISPIFEWYAPDFGDLIAFLNRYTMIKVNADAMVLYQEYDWSINEQRP